MTEFWTEVRLMLYPVLLVLGLSWAVLFWTQYQRVRLRTTLWAAWLGLAVALLGLSGFFSLIVARILGSFSSATSVMLTLGLTAVAAVLAAGVLASVRMMWRNQKEDLASAGSPSTGSGAGAGGRDD